MFYEFAYLPKTPKKELLSDDIKIVSTSSDDEFLVANSPNVNAKIYASEIDFYLKNSCENDLQKSKNISLLYQIRSLIFAYSKEEDVFDENKQTKIKTFLTYQSKTCDFYQRRGEICLKCEQICPSGAIVKDKEHKNLNIDHESCIGCGACVSVCPTASLDFASIHRESFLSIAKMLKGKIVLIVSKDVELENLEIALPKGIFPLVVDTKVLDEWHFLTLLQESGASLIFYGKIHSIPLKEISLFINKIYKLRFNAKAIYLAKNEEELRASLEKLEFIDNSFHQINDPFLQKRQATAKRLSFLVGDDDLGPVENSVYLEYAKVKVNVDKCTLCLSCAGACNTAALSIDKKTNSLLFNASLCTACGYCELNCAEEDCLSVHRGKLELNPKSFISQVLARDELFKCIECKREFATKKSVEKIASILKASFADDELKLKSLYCCGDCKAKIMSIRAYEIQKSQMEMA